MKNFTLIKSVTQFWTRFTIIILFLMTGFNIAFSAPEPFQLSTGLLSQEGIQLNWTRMKGAYLYKKFIHIVSLDPHVQAGTPIFPKGEIKDTQLFGKVTVYYDSLSLNIPIENPNHKTTIRLQLSYQGCSEYGQCFPPVKQILNINVATKSATIDSTINMPALSLNAGNSITGDETQIIEQTLEKNSLFLILGGFFVLGLVLSVTPCVLPLIPILSSIILYGHDTKKPQKVKASGLSLAYVFGMSMAYASLGFFMSLAGSHMHSFFQNPYTLLCFSFIFILLALSLLGTFEFQWSVRANNKLAQLNQRLAQMACKNYVMVLCMGFLSALIVSPCVTPPLVAALSYIATTGNTTLGASALFFMGLGLGLPLLFIGALGNTILPKTGHWMNNIKFIMGIFLLAMAFFLMQRIIPHYAVSLWGLFTVITVILLLYRVDPITPWRRIVFQTLCFLGIVLGGFTIIQNIFDKPLMAEQPYVTITDMSQLDQQLKLAKEEYKPIMIDFYADWCPDCQVMETRVFSDPAVKKLLKKFVWIKVDMTKDSESIWTLQEKYGVTGPPTFLFYTADGRFLKPLCFVGPKSKKAIIAILKQAEVLNSKSASDRISSI